MRVSLPKQAQKKLNTLNSLQYSEMLETFLKENTVQQLQRLRPRAKELISLRLSLQPQAQELLENLSQRIGLRPSDLASRVIVEMLGVNGLESFWQAKLHRELGGRREVGVPVGRIDLLTSDKLIEVKEVRGWKGAIGQALVYGTYKPAHKPAIALYGKCTSSYQSIVQDACGFLGVEVIWLEDFPWKG